MMNTLMRQYREARERHPDMLLLFRVGDFYECFDADATRAARELGLTLTTRDKVTMAGFPHHALEKHLRKLRQAGHRVAICDQVDPHNDPHRREATRVVTPGEVVEPEIAEEPAPQPATRGEALFRQMQVEAGIYPTVEYATGQERTP